MPEHASPYHGHRFPREVIAHAVRLYLRFALSFRDVEELLAERGIRVSYETVRRWVAKFGTRYADDLRRREMHRGRTWHIAGSGAPWTSTARQRADDPLPYARVVCPPETREEDRNGRGRGAARVDEVAHRANRRTRRANLGKEAYLVGGAGGLEFRSGGRLCGHPGPVVGISSQGSGELHGRRASGWRHLSPERRGSVSA